MNRISRHQLWMGIAELAAHRSTCFRRAVGAVIVQDKRLLAIGYNGAPAGEPHCTGVTCPTEGVCTRAVHAEVNALARVVTNLFAPVQMYVTESPCPNCAQIIIETSMFDEVYYIHQYRLPEGLDLLRDAGVKIRRMTPSGYVIDHLTGELIQ